MCPSLLQIFCWTDSPGFLYTQGYLYLCTWRPDILREHVISSLEKLPSSVVTKQFAEYSSLSFSFEGERTKNMYMLLRLKPNRKGHWNQETFSIAELRMVIKRKMLFVVLRPSKFLFPRGTHRWPAKLFSSWGRGSGQCWPNIYPRKMLLKMINSKSNNNFT